MDLEQLEDRVQAVGGGKLAVAGEDDDHHGLELGVVVALAELARVGASPVVHRAIAKRDPAFGLDLDVGLGSVVQVDEQVELDSLVAHVLLGDFGVEDGDVGDRALGLEHGGEQGDEDLLALGTSEQELKDDVEGGVEGVHGLRKSNPRTRTR
jgi:hypothetical protein